MFEAVLKRSAGRGGGGGGFEGVRPAETLILDNGPKQGWRGSKLG